MPISKPTPPQRSLAILGSAVRQLTAIRAVHRGWMRIIPASAMPRLTAHPLYGINVSELLNQRSLSRAMKKSAWLYFVLDHAKNIALAEVPVYRGKYKNARLSEGPFVAKCFRLYSRIVHDVRIKTHRFDLRAIRVESLHFYCLWLKARKVEYFVPVTPLGPRLKTSRWLSRAELFDALRTEGQRVRDAHERLACR
jgi:hypothetical protein